MKKLILVAAVIAFSVTPAVADWHGGHGGERFHEWHHDRGPGLGGLIGSIIGGIIGTQLPLIGPPPPPPCYDYYGRPTGYCQ